MVFPLRASVLSPGSQPSWDPSTPGTHNPPPAGRWAPISGPTAQLPLPVSFGLVGVRRKLQEDGPEARSTASPPPPPRGRSREELPAASLTRLPGAAPAAGSSFHMGPVSQNPATCHANRGYPACAVTVVYRRGLPDVRVPRTPPSPSETREKDQARRRRGRHLVLTMQQRSAESVLVGR